MWFATTLLSMCLSAGGSDLDTVAKAIAEQITEKPNVVTALYHPAFLQKVSKKKLEDLYSGFFEKQGRVVSVALISKESNESGQFTFAFEKGVQMKVSLTITKRKPHQVIALWFSPPTESYKTIDDVVKDFRKLPGKVSFQLARLGDSMEVLYEHDPDRQLAIGSTFKLYILGALLEEHKPWDAIVRLKEEYKSLPSGSLRNWPNGSPLTVHTLAAAMISVSDNTAADHLLHYAGRQRVESLMATMGHSKPQRSWPMLSTMEMFKLKSDPRLLRDYVKADLDGRRKILKGPVAEISRDDVTPYPDAAPVAVNKVEWFASASDLCRLMDWFRRRNDERALEILAINPGVGIVKKQYEYIGYKGGSEPGVLNMTWLLKTNDGTAYALSVGWNNPTTEGTDVMRLLGLVQPIIDLLGKV